MISFNEGQTMDKPFGINSVKLSTLRKLTPGGIPDAHRLAKRISKAL